MQVSSEIFLWHLSVVRNITLLFICIKYFGFKISPKTELTQLNIRWI